MPPDRDFVEQAIAGIEDAVAFLRTMREKDLEAFLASPEARYSTAYALIMAIEGVGAIAGHLVAALGSGAPRNMPEMFDALRVRGVLTDARLHESLVAMSRFRNLLVHRYWTIDYARVHTFLAAHMDDFGLFASQVVEFLDRDCR